MQVSKELIWKKGSEQKRGRGSNREGEERNEGRLPWGGLSEILSNLHASPEFKSNMIVRHVDWKWAWMGSNAMSQNTELNWGKNALPNAPKFALILKLHTTLPMSPKL